jgi:signal peptidase II
MSSKSLPSAASGWRWLPLSAVVIGLDQLSKAWIVHHFSYLERLRLLPVLDIILTYNKGAAFSMLAGASGWQRWVFVALALAVGAALLVWMRRLAAATQGLAACALSLIVAGALGNMIDRVRLGHVIDFILAHWDAHYFPAFNVADSAITIGAGLLLLDAWLEARGARAGSAGRTGA